MRLNYRITVGKKLYIDKDIFGNILVWAKDNLSKTEILQEIRFFINIVKQKFLCIKNKLTIINNTNSNTIIYIPSSNFLPKLIYTLILK